MFKLIDILFVVWCTCRLLTWYYIGEDRKNNFNFNDKVCNKIVFDWIHFYFIKIVWFKLNAGLISNRSDSVYLFVRFFRINVHKANLPSFCPSQISPKANRIDCRFLKSLLDIFHVKSVSYQPENPKKLGELRKLMAYYLIRTFNLCCFFNKI